MADNRGKPIGELKLDDDADIDDVQDLVDIMNDNDYMVTTEWSKGKFKLNKRTNMMLGEEE